MNILYDYDGASIDIIDNNKEKNIVYLSLKKENDKLSHYYNFKVENYENKDGIIYIKNMKHSAYYCKDRYNSPYTKKMNNWERLKDFKINSKGDLEIKIMPNTFQEISLLPRYTKKDLEVFIEKNKNEFLNIEYEPVEEIIIGDKTLPAIVFIARQHPGETLSSFFVEGVIEEILESKLYEKYCFVIYPLVNRQGIKNGNHRYTNGVDYNRSWNKKDAPEEIKIIKNNLKNYNIKYFIDVHNDEITKEHYIRTLNKDLKIKSLAGIKVMLAQSNTRRFARALIKQRKIINLFSKTATKYIFKKYHCNTMIIEISITEDFNKINLMGRKFVNELIKE